MIGLKFDLSFEEDRLAIAYSSLPPKTPPPHPPDPARSFHACYVQYRTPSLTTPRRGAGIFWLMNQSYCWSSTGLAPKPMPGGARVRFSSNRLSTPDGTQAPPYPPQCYRSPDTRRPYPVLNLPPRIPPPLFPDSFPMFFFPILLPHSGSFAFSGPFRPPATLCFCFLPLQFVLVFIN